MAQRSDRLRKRVHKMIDQLPDEALIEGWSVMSELYYDSYMLEAIQAAKQSFTPGDSLTQDEALQFLLHLSAHS